MFDFIGFQYTCPEDILCKFFCFFRKQIKKRGVFHIIILESDDQNKQENHLQNDPEDYLSFLSKLQPLDDQNMQEDDQNDQDNRLITLLPNAKKLGE